MKRFSLINWETVCLLMKFGGMEVIDLEYHNIALLLRWWWRAYVEADCLWTTMAIRLHWRGNYKNGPIIWIISGSFFWNKLYKLKHIFHWSCFCIVGNGRSTCIWFDSGAGMPLANSERPQWHIDFPTISLHDAASVQAMLQLHTSERDKICSIHFTEDNDSIYWRWDHSGVYTATSAYRALIKGGKIAWPLEDIWKARVPPTVKIFGYLLLRSKILIRDSLRRRGMQCEMECVMYSQCHTESPLRLFFLCPYAVQVWYTLITSSSLFHISPCTIVECTYTTTKQEAARRGQSTKEWASRFLCTCWLLWKQRNEVIFGGQAV